MPVSLAAQAAATVASTNAVYAAIDEVSSTLPIRGLLVGQRPWSRRELARVVLAFESAREGRARDSLSTPLPARIGALIDSLASAYSSEILEITGRGTTPAVRAMVRSARLDVTGTNSVPRRIPSNGLGGIDAITNPIVEPNWGRPVAHGGTASLELEGEADIGSHFALVAQPRVSWLQPKGATGYEQADFQRLYARGTVANVAVQIGLDEVLWGQAGGRGLLLSANPRPLHAVTIANDTAVMLPWVFRLLGPTRVALMIADLGTAQNFPGARLVNYKLSATPTSRLEVGAAMMDEMGGSGSPRCSVACQVKDLFPYVFWAIHPASDPLATNKVAQGELRFRIPEAAGLTLSYEGDMDDFDLRRIRSMLWENTAHMLGARFDRLSPDGRLALDLQVHHTPLTLYEHYQYNSGLTYRESIIGDPLGVHGTGAYATLAWRESLLTRIAISGVVERRDPSMYSGETRNNRYVMYSRRPTENRARLYLSVGHDVLGTGMAYIARAGLEQVENNAFSGATRTNGIVDISLHRYF